MIIAHVYIVGAITAILILMIRLYRALMKLVNL